MVIKPLSLAVITSDLRYRPVHRLRPGDHGAHAYKLKPLSESDSVEEKVVYREGDRMWYRFYDLTTNESFFSDRNGGKYYDIMEISARLSFCTRTGSAIDPIPGSSGCGPSPPKHRTAPRY